METNYECEALPSSVIDGLIKEMKDFTKEELEGLIKCIENDSSVTKKRKYRNGFRIIIDDYFAMKAYMLASCILENKMKR